MSSYYLESYKKNSSFSWTNLHKKFLRVLEVSDNGIDYIYFRKADRKYCVIWTPKFVTVCDTKNDIVMLTCQRAGWGAGWLDLGTFMEDLVFCFEELDTADNRMRDGGSPSMVCLVTGHTWLVGNSEGVVPYLYDIEGI